MPIKNKGGQPTRYRKAYDKQAYKLTLLGYTDIQLADFFEVSKATINNWKHDFPSFLDSLKAGKDIADADVAVSLYQRAKGYEHVEEKVFCTNGEITTHKTVKKYPPDPLAIKYWMNNRQSKTWREKVVEEVDSVQDIKIEFVNANTSD